MDIKTKLMNKDKFVLKFADAPFNNNGVLNPGWAEPTFDDFYTRLVDKAVLLEQSANLPMTSLQHDLDMLGTKVELQTQRNNDGSSSGLTDTETSPNKNRKQLLAQPLQAKTVIKDNFLEENIEGPAFMDTYVNLLVEEMAPAVELFGVYANKSVSTVSGEGTGYKTTDGILKQCTDIHGSGSSATTLGLSKLVYMDNMVQGVFDAIERYIRNDGNIANATMVLPPQMYARLMIEIAQDRETDFGDFVYTDGEVTKILGMEIKQDKVLKDTRNGYDTMKFTNGEYAANGTNVDKMKYGFIGQPNNIIFGMMRDIETRNQWDIDELGYKVALLCKADVKVLWDQDTLAVPFTLNNSPQ